MQFQVPQFIEVESKIFGQLSAKQFAYVTGGVGVILIIYYFTQQFILSVVLGGPVLGLGLLLAFYKVNNRPFGLAIEAFLRYVISNKIYLWHKQSPTQNQTQIVDRQGQVVDNSIYIPTVSAGRLGKVGWDLNVAGKKEEAPINKPAENK